MRLNSITVCIELYISCEKYFINPKKHLYIVIWYIKRLYVKQKDENFTNYRSHDIVLDNYRIYRKVFEISFSHICSKQKDESTTNCR